MGPKSVTYRPTQAHESSRLMQDLLEFTDIQLKEKEVKQPMKHQDGWEAYVRRYTTSVVMGITYGHRITSVYNNSDLHKIYDVLATLTNVGQPGTWLCDDFPLIRHLPDILAPWRKKGLALHRWEMELWGGLLRRMKDEREQGTATACYVGDLLEKRGEDGTKDSENLSDLLLSCAYASRFDRMDANFSLNLS